MRYRDPNKVERTRSFRLKTDAARFAAGIETDISHGAGSTRPGAEDVLLLGRPWLATTYHLKPEDPGGLPVGAQLPPATETG